MVRRGLASRDLWEPGGISRLAETPEGAWGGGSIWMLGLCFLVRQLYFPLALLESSRTVVSESRRAFIEVL